MTHSFWETLWDQPVNLWGGMPLWAWNGTMTREGVRQKLKEMKALGFAGAFVHPRPGMTTPYLSEEWFDLWGTALSCAKELGLKLCIYDENTYPSGYAGGNVASGHPEREARAVRCYQENDIPSPDKVVLARFAICNGSDAILLQEGENRQADAVFVLEPAYHSAWYGGFGNVDLTNPEAVQAFLSCTHERYAAFYSSEFGRTIPALFTDEPAVSPGTEWIEDPMSFPYSETIETAFFERCGLSLKDHFAALCLNVLSVNGINAEKIRYDYTEALYTAWIKAFFQPVSAWCTSHNLHWTGHFFDEHWPYAFACASPDVMSLYEYMDWPGIDLLTTERVMDKSVLRISFRELASAAQQLSKERTLCECYGAGGWDASVSDFKRLGDWCLVHGINLFCPHIVMHSYLGTRKEGYPPSFDSRQPWAQAYAEIQPYFARLSGLMAKSRRNHRVLVLHPTSSWEGQAAFQHPSTATDGYNGTRCDAAYTSYAAFLEKLERLHVCFDLGNERLMHRHGSIKNAKFQLGQCAYSLILIPNQVRTLRSETLELLRLASASGVRVFTIGAEKRFLDGDPNQTVLLPFLTISEEMALRLATETDALPISGEDVEAERLCFSNGETAYFLINSQDTPRCCHFPSGETWCRLDALDTQPIPHIFSDELWLSGVQSAIVYRMSSGPSEHPSVRPSHSLHSQIVSAPLYDITPDCPNILVLDCGSLQLPGYAPQKISTVQACEAVYRAYGFPQNPWYMAIQFRDQILRRPPFPVESGFTFRYSFSVAEFPAALSLAWERPEIFKATINGVSVFPSTTQWMQEFCTADILPYLRKGENTIELACHPFHILAELHPVYLLGGFSVTYGTEPVLYAAKPLQPGDLAEQGYPFFSGHLRYRFRFYAPSAAKSWSIQIPPFTGTALRILLNDQFAGQAFALTGEVLSSKMALQAGENELVLELACSLRNIFGPFHNCSPLRHSAWPGAWHQETRPDFDVVHYGLFIPSNELLINLEV